MPRAAETYVFTELANITGDRMEQYINRELAKRMAARVPPPHRGHRGRAPQPGYAPRPDAPRDISEPRPDAPRDKSQPRPHAPQDKSQPRSHAPRDKSQPRSHAPRDISQPRPHAPRDKSQPRSHAPRDKSQPRSHAPLDISPPRPHAPRDISQSRPHAPLNRSHHSNQSVQADTRRQSRWHGLFFDVTYHVMREKMKQLMQNDIYSARERLKALAAMSRRHKQSVRFRMGFVFRKLEDLVHELRVLWEYSYKNFNREEAFRVFVVMAYYQRSMKKYVDLVYVYERVGLVYERYMAAKKALLTGKLKPKYQQQQ